MKRRNVILTAGTIVGGSIAATAYTSGSVTRDASIDVVSDDAGLIALGDGTTGTLISHDGTGRLTIDLTRGGANGANVDSTFKFGDAADAANSYAFTITNNDTQARDIKVDFTLNSGDPDGTVENLQFKLYNSDGSPFDSDVDGNILSTATESAAYTASGVASDGSQTLHVVLEVDTTGLNAETDDLSGNLEISA